MPWAPLVCWGLVTVLINGNSERASCQSWSPWPSQVAQILTKSQMSRTYHLLNSADHKHGILLAYRHLYRQGLKAIRYSSPSRHVLLRILRSSFRSRCRSEFDPQRITNTLLFLQRASATASIEHKILKNLILVRYWEQPQVWKARKMWVSFAHATAPFWLYRFHKADQLGAHRLAKPNKHFNMTLNLLNESLGLCLRWGPVMKSNL